MIEITLNLEGKNKKFTQSKMTLGGMRRMAEMQKIIGQLQAEGNEEENGLQMIDEMAETIVILFKNQFTFEDLVDGLEFETMEDFNDIVEDIFSKVGGEGKTTPKKPTTKAPSK